MGTKKVLLLIVLITMEIMNLQIVDGLLLPNSNETNAKENLPIITKVKCNDYLEREYIIYWYDGGSGGQDDIVYSCVNGKSQVLRK